MEFLNVRWNFEKLFVVDCNGRSGGLAVLWKDTIDVSLQTYSQWHIDLEIRPEGNLDVYRFTGFYENLKTSQRKLSWNLLKHLHSLSDKPWICGGDFNEILHDDEKVGGNMRLFRQMVDFRDVIDKCGFNEVTVKGPLNTWSRK
ncbi:hypothetical protein REPUB_Repub02eG0123500 [Reevesia pubescens]